MTELFMSSMVVCSLYAMMLGVGEFWLSGQQVCECNTNETVKPNQAMLLFTYLLLLTVLVDEFKSVL